MKILKKGLLLLVIIISGQTVFAQSAAEQARDKNCEKLFGQKMQKLQNHVVENEMSPKEAYQFVQSKIAKMRASNPECFPEIDIKEIKLSEERYQKEAQNKAKHEKQYHKIAAKKLQIDSKDLSDEEIREVNRRYEEAQKICRKELKEEVEKRRLGIQKARTGAERLQLIKKIDKETRQMVHECTMDRMIESL